MSTLTAAARPDRAGRHVARWRALGCTVHVETRRPDELDLACRLVTDVLTDVDEVASRFRDDSDLSRVNRSPNEWVRVDPLLVVAVRVALAAAETTDGLVDPLLGRPLVELGYDRTFTRLRPVTAAVTASTSPPPLGAWREIGLTEDAIRLPPETALDLGATGKAWCTDLAVTALEHHLDGGAIVSLGGDLRTVGREAWEVAVSERPDQPADDVVTITGALATSTTLERRWSTAAGERHHLLDPRTGLPAQTPWRTATVAAGTCVGANTAATAALVGGTADRPFPFTVHAARIVAHDGGVHLQGAWPDPTGRRA